MKKFLVVKFNRYDAEKSINHFVEANSTRGAYVRAVQSIYPNLCDEIDDMYEYFDENSIKSDEIFTSLSEDECDWLIYNLDNTQPTI